jgi:hypothetical protein
MNKVSKISLSLFSLLFYVFLISSHSLAQPGQQQRPPMLPDSTQIVKMVNELAKAVPLSDQQKEKVLKIHFEHFNQVKVEMKNEQKHHDEIRKAHDEMRTKFEEQIKALLNEKQQAEFDKFIKSHHERRDNRDHRAPR